MNMNGLVNQLKSDIIRYGFSIESFNYTNYYNEKMVLNGIRIECVYKSPSDGEKKTFSTRLDILEKIIFLGRVFFIDPQTVEFELISSGFEFEKEKWDIR